MKLLLISAVIVLTLPAHAYNYGATPTGAANPPEIISQDPNIPSNPNIYGPAKPLSKEPPPGTVAMPGATNNNNTNYAPVYTPTPE